LENMLIYKRQCAWKHADKDEIFSFCEGYKSFLNAARTEREYITRTEKVALEKGFVPISEKEALQPGDKIYRINRGKGIMLAVIGSAPIEDGIRMVGAHVDSPRLDLKPNPLYEDGEMALMKTHYYGGLRKY